MNKDQVKGKMKEIKGDIKERIGGAAKDRSTQAEGILEQQKGKVQRGYGDVKEDIEKDRNSTREDPESP